MRAVLFAVALVAIACSRQEEKEEEEEKEKEEEEAATPGTPATPAEVGREGPPGLVVPTLTAIPTDPASIEAGKKVYEARGCGACHQFGAKLVGPDLTGLMTRRPLPWIERMILHPSEMVRQDPVAKDLFKTHMTEMTNQGVTEEELPKLLAYIQSQGG
ncbi:MAG: cytochrome c [Pseudomonadota bacterium]|nr:cytochrome c [Pseudomonadota bacterium]